MITLSPDETALELLHRLSLVKSFQVRTGGSSSEQIGFNECVEVITSVEEMSEFVLSAALDFAFQYPNGIIVHVSTGNNLHQSLLQSGININTTSLQQFGETGRIKCYTVQNVLQLFAVSELLRTSFSASEKVLILFEGMSNLLFAQKNTNGTIPPTSLITSTIKSITQLSQTYHMLCIWINSAHPQKSGLREGNPRDVLTITWKRRIQRVIHFNQK